MKFAPSTAPTEANAQHEPHVPCPLGGVTAPSRKTRTRICHKRFKYLNTNKIKSFSGKQI